MTLIDRYVRAVGDNLPRAQRDDILQELTDSLHSRFEDEEATRGRPLADDEQVAILRSYGHPMAVAARYRGDERSVTFGRRLIGPELFPTYMKVLTANVAITIVVVAMIAILGGSTIWSGALGALVPIALQFTIVTAIFIWIDRRWIRDPDGWDPRTVSAMGPDVDVSTLDGLAIQLIGREHTRAVAVTTSILEFGLLAIGLTIWVALGGQEQIGPWVPGPGWVDIYPAATAVIVFALLIPIVNLIRPTWTRFRVVGHVFVDAATIVIGVVSLALGSWVLLADPATATPDLVELTEMINTIIRITIAAAVVLTVVTTGLELRRLWRMRGGKTPTPVPSGS